MPNSKEDGLTMEQLQEQFTGLDAEITRLMAEKGDRSLEISEHNLVLKYFGRAGSGQCCFRKLGGVLVEHTVAEVRPSVENNRKTIENSLSHIEANLKKKTEEKSKLIAKHGLNETRETKRGR